MPDLRTTFQFGRWLVLFLAGLVLLLIVLFLLAQTPWGKRVAAHGIARVLSRQLRLEVHIEGIEGFIPFDASVERITIREQDREVADMEDLRWRWSVRPFLRGVLHMEYVTARSVSISATQREREKKGEWEPRRLAHLTRLILDRVEVESLVFTDPVIPGGAVLSVSGGFAPDHEHERVLALRARLKSWGETEYDDEDRLVELEADLAVNFSGGTLPIHMQLECRFQGADIAWPSGHLLLGSEISGSGRATYKADGALSIESLSVDAEGMTANATAYLDPGRPQIKAELFADCPDASVWRPLFQRDLAGAVRLEARMDGSFAQPGLKMRLTSGELTIESERFSNITALWELDEADDGTAGRVQVEAKYEGQPFAARSDYVWKDRRLSWPTLSVEGFEAEMSGQVSWDMTHHTAEGEIHMISEDLSGLTPLLGRNVSGRTELILKLRSENGRQDLVLEGDVRDVRHPRGEVERADISARLQDVRRNLLADARFEIRNMRAGEALLSNAVAKVWGDLAVLEYAIDAEGWFNEEIELSCNGQVTFNGALESVRFERFEARYGEHPVLLLRPATFRVAEDGYVVERMDFRLGPGYLMGSARISPEDVDAHLRVTKFPLRTLGFAGVLDEAATVEGELRVSGRADNPSGTLSILFSEIRPRHVEYWDAPPATLNVNARLEDRKFSVVMALAELSDDPIRFDLSFPLELSFHPPALTWPPEGDVSGHFSVDADLENLARLFLLDLHFVYGKLSARYEISGTVENPSVTGRLEVRDGIYENDRTGTVLRDIELRLRADNHRLQLDHITATDGRRGRLELKGHMALKPAEQFPFKLEGTLSDLRVMRQDFVEVTARGSLTCEGTLHESLLEGDIVLGPVEVTVPERVPPGLVELEVIEIFEEEESEPPPPPRPRAHAMRLDVTVRLPDRGFLRGRGLDSEWSGQVNMTGRADEPDIRGELSVVRGRFNFFGRRLQLTHGTVTFDGTFPPSPYLDVTAEARVRGITGILRLSGDAMAPEISLDSMPPMPEDEILARLLFGRDISRITPWQALVMAQAVTSLRREGTTYDFMGRTRRILGVDQFEIRPAEEEEGVTTVSVGKYVRDDVYVELERGAEAETGRARVEIELLPTVTLETVVGTNAEGGLGLNWRWDY